MMPRSGSMHAAPTAPVKVIGFPERSGPGPASESVVDERGTIMESSGTRRKRVIVSYAHPRTQGTDWPAAGAARGLSVLQRGWRHDLRRQGARAARPRAQLSGRVRVCLLYTSPSPRD